MKNNKTLCPSDSGHRLNNGSFKGARGGSDDDSSEDGSIFEKNSFLDKDDRAESDDAPTVGMDRYYHHDFKFTKEKP
jgi:hypothetical protein